MIPVLLEPPPARPRRRRNAFSTYLGLSDAPVLSEQAGVAMMIEFMRLIIGDVGTRKREIEGDRRSVDLRDPERPGRP